MYETLATGRIFGLSGFHTFIPLHGSSAPPPQPPIHATTPSATTNSACASVAVAVAAAVAAAAAVPREQQGREQRLARLHDRLIEDVRERSRVFIARHYFGAACLAVLRAQAREVWRVSAGARGVQGKQSK